MGPVEEEDREVGEEAQCPVVEVEWAEGEGGVVVSLQVEVEEVVEVVNNLDRRIGIIRATLEKKISIIDVPAHSALEMVAMDIRIRRRHLLGEGIPDEETGVMVATLVQEMVHSRQPLGVRGMKIGAPSQTSRLLDW